MEVNEARGVWVLCRWFGEGEREDRCERPEKVKGKKDVVEGVGANGDMKWKCLIVEKGSHGVLMTEK